MDLFIYPALLIFASLKQKTFNPELHYYSKPSTLFLSTSPLVTAASMSVESPKRFSTFQLLNFSARRLRRFYERSESEEPFNFSTFQIPISPPS